MNYGLAMCNSFGDRTELLGANQFVLRISVWQYHYQTHLVLSLSLISEPNSAEKLTSIVI